MGFSTSLWPLGRSGGGFDGWEIEGTSWVLVSKRKKQILRSAQNDKCDMPYINSQTAIAALIGTNRNDKNTFIKYKAILEYTNPRITLTSLAYIPVLNFV